MKVLNQEVRFILYIWLYFLHITLIFKLLYFVPGTREIQNKANTSIWKFMILNKSNALQSNNFD